MPSAADNVKVDGKSGGKNHPQQTAVTDNGLPDSTAGLNVFKQAIIFMEHKIRNLEKRKSKLESYRDLQKAGKELNADQKTAVAKYDEVTNTLEFARDLCKNFLGFSNASEKEAKKQAKREAAQRSQGELAKTREIILIQDALDQMGNDSVREDFLAGQNGAPKLTAEEMKLLDDIYPATTPKHEPGNPAAFSNEVQTAAEHLHGIVEGKQKEVCGGSYAQIKEILGKIHESGYFDQAQPTEDDPAVEELQADIPVDQTDVSESYSHEDASGTQSYAPYNATSSHAALAAAPSECLPVEAVESGAAASRHSNNRPDHPAVVGDYGPPHLPQTRQGPAGAGAPPAPSPIDEGQKIAFYRSHTQAIKPISDIVGDTSYIFLQESEIEESVGTNACPTAGTGPAVATATNGMYYAGQLPTQHALPAGQSQQVAAAEMTVSSGGAYPATAAIAGAAVLQRPGTVAQTPTATGPVSMASTNGTSGACPAPANNRRGGGGGGSNATQSSYYTNSTLENERGGSNFVPAANMGPQQHNANAHGSQATTTGPAANRSSYYNASADSSDRSERSFSRNNRSNHGNSRTPLDCGYYASGGERGGGETAAPSSRTNRGGPGSSHSYYQNNSHGFPKNGTRGQQQRSGNSRSNKIQ